MTPDEAIDRIARHALATAALDVGEDNWESYPELGQYDWAAVGERMAALAPFPPADEVDEATKVLAARANTSEESTE